MIVTLYCSEYFLIYIYYNRSVRVRLRGNDRLPVGGTDAFHRTKRNNFTIETTGAVICVHATPLNRLECL